MIAIINGCGANIASIQFALDRLGKKSLLTTDANQIKAASHVILPGVGNAQHAMKQLEKLQLIDVLSNLQQPVLGICLGMQILYAASEEGNVPCLNIFPGKIKRLQYYSGLPLPHMGWNQLKISQRKNLLLEGIKNSSYVYFIHSYMAPLNAVTISIATYGESFSAIVNQKNFYGVQFHPERSGKVGEKILKNFLELESINEYISCD